MARLCVPLTLAMSMPTVTSSRSGTLVACATAAIPAAAMTAAAAAAARRLATQLLGQLAELVVVGGLGMGGHPQAIV